MIYLTIYCIGFVGVIVGFGFWNKDESYEKEGSMFILTAFLWPFILLIFLPCLVCFILFRLGQLIRKYLGSIV